MCAFKIMFGGSVSRLFELSPCFIECQPLVCFFQLGPNSGSDEYMSKMYKLYMEYFVCSY